MKDVTLCYLISDGKILLAMKKRGFGEGKLNGYGGKVEPGETIEEALSRETFEESKVRMDLSSAVKVAEIEFYFPDVPKEKNWDERAHVYFVTKWSGVPVETEEMKPAWYDIHNIPFDSANFWAADKIWLKKAIEGKKLRAKVVFNGKGESIKSYEDQLLLH
jgi:ADP-ribose pyrophosphatase YjhB (NUDIX family)